MAHEERIKVRMGAGAGSVRRRALVFAVVVAGVGGLLAWYEFGPPGAHIEARLQQLGGWGVLLSIGLMIAHSFVPFPAELIAFANGMVYGPLWGTVITWIGAMAGAWAAFGCARLLGRPFVERLVDPRRLERIDGWLEAGGPWWLLGARLVPVVSFNLVNYAAGLTRVGFWRFTWTTGVGILPPLWFMVTLGHHMDRLELWTWAALGSAVVVVSLLGAALHHRTVSARRRDRPGGTDRVRPSPMRGDRAI